MTRINCVPVDELSDKHLGAEYRELPRVFGLVRAAAERGERPDDPRNPRAYQLGRGHLRFFYARLAWLARRHAVVVEECRTRGRAVSFPTPPTQNIPPEWFGDWTPDHRALATNRARIAMRTAEAAARNHRRTA